VFFAVLLSVLIGLGKACDYVQRKDAAHDPMEVHP
jgi:hypothetical protein